MDLLDDDGSSLPTGMGINMVFTLPTKFRGVNEEINHLCLGTKEVMFE
jgi:hypothetical protein